MGRRIASVALAAMVTCGWAGGAKAETVYLRYTGVITSETVTGDRSLDYTGLFGANSASLVGTNYTVVVTEDFSNAWVISTGSSFFAFTGFPTDIYIANKQFGTTTPANDDIVRQFNDGKVSGIQGEYGNYNDSDALRLAGGFTSASASTPSDPFQDFYYSLKPQDTGRFYIGFVQHQYDQGSETGRFEADLALSITSAQVSHSQLSAVPLPATAPLFGTALLVVGAAGYSMRRRPTSTRI